MGKKTSIYVNNEDMAVFEAARKLTKDGNLSHVIADALREYINVRQDEQEHIIEVGIWYAKSAADTIKISFRGRLLAEGKVLTGQLENRNDRHTKWRIYRTHKGKFLIWWELWSHWAQEDVIADYIVLNEFPEIGTVYIGTATETESTPLPGGLVSDAAEKLGKKVAKKLDV